MALRGSNQVSSYAPSKLAGPSDDLLQRVSALYEADPQLHGLWNEAVATRMTAGDVEAGGQNGAAIGASRPSCCRGESGDRVAMIETNGWDTHSGQRGRLKRSFATSTRRSSALKTGLGADWANTLVIVATEFGRTAAAQRHRRHRSRPGVGRDAARRRGRRRQGIADWPGLSNGALYEGRDLKPTTDLDALIAGALAQHYGLEPGASWRTLFPESRGTAVRAAPHRLTGDARRRLR